MLSNKACKPSKLLSKTKYFIREYLNDNGESEIINRYDLPHEPCALYYSSGDGIFRNDGTLGKKYKFIRFSATLDCRKKSSIAWKKISKEEEEQIKTIHSHLPFNNKSGNTIEFIKFFGKADDTINDQGIRADILKEIKKLPCANCGTTKDIECDHKNDLYLLNDKRVQTKNTQTIDDFQPLCKHCNDVKRAAKEKMLRENKRYSAKNLGYTIDFTSGNETLHKEDPHWYTGTYWGDCKAFKHKLTLK
jgi:hypothetical protein